MRLNKKGYAAITIIILGIITALVIMFVKISTGSSNSLPTTSQDAQHKTDLFSYKNPYIGDNSNDGNLVNSLTFPNGLKYAGIELKTAENDIKTMKIIFNKVDNVNPQEFDYKRSFSYNAMIIFSLIENCEQITYAVNENGQTNELSSRQRPWAIEIAKGDPYKIADTKEHFQDYLDTIKKIDFGKFKVYTSNLEQSIADALLTENEGQFYQGELAAQGHITLLTQEDSPYTIASVYAKYVQMQFQNGIFELCATSSMPYKLTFSKDKYGNYTLTKSEKPQDGALYVQDLYKLFPEEIVNKIQLIPNNTDTVQNIDNQIIQYSKGYLDSISRSDAKISLSYQEKAYPPLSEENAMEFDALYRAYTDYPYFVGTLEKLEDNIRFIYETKYQKQDTSDTFGFTKTRYDTNEVIENVKVKLDNGNLSVIEGELRKSYDEIKAQPQEQPPAPDNPQTDK